MFIINVEGIIVKDGKVLIGKRSINEEHAGGELSLIGGKVKLEGNTSNILENNLKREIKEETGLEVCHFKYIHNTSFITATGIHVLNVVFTCEWLSGVAEVKDKDEISELYWMTFEEIIHHERSPFYLVDSIKIAKLNQ